MTGNGRELGGSFALGRRRVRRAGYGAMQLADDGSSGRRGITAKRCGCCARPSGPTIVSKVGARRDASGASLRSWEARELRQGIEDNLRAFGTSRRAAVNLRLIDPSQTPGRRFDA